MEEDYPDQDEHETVYEEEKGDLGDDDELSIEEAAFMEGYDQASED